MQIAQPTSPAAAAEATTYAPEQPALIVQQAQVMPRIDAAVAKPRVVQQHRKRKCSLPNPKAEYKLPAIRRDSAPMATFTYAVKKGNNSRLILSTLRKRPWMYGVPAEQHEGVDFYWASHLERGKLNTHSKKGNKVLLNHLQHNAALSTKKGLFFNLRKWCEQSGAQLTNIVPTTFFLSSDPDSSEDERAAFLAYNAAHAASQSTNLPETTRSSVSSNATGRTTTAGSLDEEDRGAGELIWIMKPATFTNRGYGISVVPNAEEVMNALDKASKYDKYGWIVQQYIERPLLVHGRKFDIRCFVLVLYGNAAYTRRAAGAHQQPHTRTVEQRSSSEDGVILNDVCEADTSARRDNANDAAVVPPSNVRATTEPGKSRVRKRVTGNAKGTRDVVAYFYEDGYVRTSGTKYKLDKKCLTDRMIHLTNDAVQKKDKNYGKYETGNKLTFAELQSYIDTAYPGERPGVVQQHIVPTMKTLAQQSIAATADTFKNSRHSPSFELFGYDFMITEAFHVYLIEVNSNPCLEFACDMLEHLLVDMMDDTFKLAVDSLFLPSSSGQTMTRSCMEAVARLQQRQHQYQQIYPPILPLPSPPTPNTSPAATSS